MTALIFGASAGVGRSLARQLAASGRDLILVARSGRDIEAEAAHLRTCFGVRVECMTLDATDPVAVETALTSMSQRSDVIDLLFPLGSAEDVDDGLLPSSRSLALIQSNLATIITAIGVFLPGLMQAERANIVGFGSVAAIRGRGSNMVYAAAKRGLESYFESIRHRTSASGVRVQFYRLGYVDTQMSFGRKMPFPMVSPDQVARHVVRYLGRDLGLVHYPRFWFAIGAILKSLPWIIYRRLQF